MAILVSEYVQAVVMNIYKTCCLVMQTVLIVCMLPYKIITSILFPTTPKTFRSVFITGASSGIGAELARQYASKGVRLTLTARHVNKLCEVKCYCEALGAIVHTVALDVTDKDAMHTALHKADDEYPLDLVIANAGLGGPSAVPNNGDILSNVSSKVTEANVIGVCNTLSPALERMRLRKSGQLVINASAMGLLGMTCDSFGFAYSSSKIWACTYGMGLRSLLQRENIGVTVICAGGVKTSRFQTDVDSSGLNIDIDKLAIDCESAVKQMIKGIANDVGMLYINVSFWWLIIGAFGFNLIPPFLWNGIAPFFELQQ